MKIKTVEQLNKVIEELEYLEKKIKNGTVILKEEYRFRKLLREANSFMKVVKVIPNS